MIIAIASGKGGTGKTTVATNLALIAGKDSVYVDCDVEEPNGHLFLDPHIEKAKNVHSLVPRVDFTLCNFCGKCREVCRYNAIAVLPKTVVIFDELCHSCGGCQVACPEKAIYEQEREIGVTESGHSKDTLFIHGRLHVGEAMSPPLIRAVKKEIPDRPIKILDSPPGTSCPVITAIAGADVVALVTEPTPFGLHDLKLAVDMVKALGLPFGVVINRDGIGDDRVDKYCKEQQIPILARIPDSRPIAEAYSKGRMAIHAVPEVKKIFDQLLDVLITMAEKERVKAS